MDTPQEKICPDCGPPAQPLRKFRNDKYRPDGKSTKCRICLSRIERELHAKNPATRRQGSVRWRAAHPEERQAYEDANRDHKNQRRRERYAEDPEKELVKNAAWYENNKPERKISMAVWERTHKPQRKAKRLETFLKDPEGEITKRRKRDKDWRDKNPKKVQAKNAASYAKYPEAHKEKRDRRRAAKANAEVNDLTLAQFQEICERQKGRCANCNRRRKLTRDHVVALNNHGNHTVQNLVALCRACNSRKSDSDQFEKAVQLNLLTVASPKPYKPRKKKVS